MKLRKDKRGIVGIEAAIVLIAFIVIASALSYVVINMGFFATQKTKETITEGIGEATSALQLDGTVSAKTNDEGNITHIIFPVKLSVGKAAVDLSKDSIVVSVYLADAELLNIYNGTNGPIDLVDVDTALGLMNVNESKFFMYNDDGDSVLESREKAFLVISLDIMYVMPDYATVKIEVKTARGAALTVVRSAPGGMPSNTFVDLG